MAEAKDAWEKATADVQALGQLLQSRYEAAAAATPPTEHDDVENAARGLGDNVNRAMDAVAASVQDEEVKGQARAAGAALLEALAASFADFGDAVRQGGSAPAAPADPAPLTTPEPVQIAEDDEGDPAAGSPS